MTMVTGRVPSLPPAYRLVALERVGSTSDEAKRLAEEGAEDGTIVWALEQTAGRGRLGRVWSSPPGNLYCSLILRPDCALAQATQLSFVAALGVGGALGALAPPMVELRYKWPNDVLLNERKAAGILLESSTRPDGMLEYLILGVGMNVETHPKETAFPATSVRAEGARVEVIDALESFARHFLSWVNRWMDDGFAPVRDAWTQRAWRLGERLEVALGDGTAAGVFTGIGEDGTLTLRQDDGVVRHISAGDVMSTRPGAA